MKKYILGLDLGTNSIGWSCSDPDTGTLLDGGVDVFPMSLEQEKGKSPCALRREQRQGRRQYERKTRKKQQLKKLLQLHGMYPMEASKEKSFFKQNPYKLRSQALTQPLTRHALGRVFYHLAQRRGFPLAASLDEDQAKVLLGKKKQQGEQEQSITIIPSTAALLQDQTLGQALYQIDQQSMRTSTGADGTEKTAPQHQGRENLRRRYTNRKWYEDEFAAIWQKQAAYHSDLLTPALQKQMHHILFFQRPLKSQKHLVEKCTFEPNLRRAAQANLYFEQFRFYHTLNNIKVNEQPLTAEQRNTLIKKKEGMYDAKDRTRDQIAKDLKVAPEAISLTKDQVLPVCKVAYKLQKLWGQKAWQALDEEAQNQRLNTIRSLTSKTQCEKLAKKWNIDPAELAKTRKDLPKHYAKLSERVIRATLLYLKQGIPYYIALTLASLGKVFEWKDGPNKTIAEQARAFLEKTLSKRRAQQLGPAQAMAAKCAWPGSKNG